MPPDRRIPSPVSFFHRAKDLYNTSFLKIVTCSSKCELLPQNFQKSISLAGMRYILNWNCLPFKRYKLPTVFLKASDKFYYWVAGYSIFHYILKNVFFQSAFVVGSSLVNTYWSIFFTMVFVMISHTFCQLIESSVEDLQRRKSYETSSINSFFANSSPLPTTKKIVDKFLSLSHWEKCISVCLRVILTFSFGSFLMIHSLQKQVLHMNWNLLNKK